MGWPSLSFSRAINFSLALSLIPRFAHIKVAATLETAKIHEITPCAGVLLGILLFLRPAGCGATVALAPSAYSVHGTVTYPYARGTSSVPKPSSMVLLGSGLLAFGLALRKRL